MNFKFAHELPNNIILRILGTFEFLAMTMINWLCVVIDQQKTFPFISIGYHCWKTLPSRIWIWNKIQTWFEKPITWFQVSLNVVVHCVTWWQVSNFLNISTIFHYNFYKKKHIVIPNSAQNPWVTYSIDLVIQKISFLLKLIFRVTELQEALKLIYFKKQSCALQHQAIILVLSPFSIAAC